MITVKDDLNFKGKLQEFNRFRQGLPRFIGSLAVTFYKDSFRRQGWIDKSYERWKPRKAGARRNKGRAVLVDTGRLRRSVRIIRTGPDFVAVGSDEPHARIHNEGGKITARASVRAHVRKNVSVRKNVYNVRTRRGRMQKVKIGPVKVKAHTRRMDTTIPRRQFMGKSDFLNRRILLNIDNRLKQILR